MHRIPGHVSSTKRSSLVECLTNVAQDLWVKFQLEELCFQETDESIRLTMQHLPKDIFETCNRLLTRITEEGSVETCNKVFQYVAAAKRPLTLDELGEAISLEPYQTCFMPERLVNNPKASFDGVMVSSLCMIWTIRCNLHTRASKTDSAVLKLSAVYSGVFTSNRTKLTANLARFASHTSASTTSKHN